MKDYVLVTGASGFLGSHLVGALLATGCRVRALVRRPPDKPWLRQDGLEIYIGDLCDPSAVDSAVNNAETVYHLGATMSGGWADY